MNNVITQTKYKVYYVHISSWKVRKCSMISYKLRPYHNDSSFIQFLNWLISLNIRLTFNIFVNIYLCRKNVFILYFIFFIKYEKYNEYLSNNYEMQSHFKFCAYIYFK